MIQADEFDIFVSYARKDNLSGYVSQVVEEILKKHHEFTGGRELTYFFDRSVIENFTSWQSAILHKGINKSKLFLAFLSPNYFNSDVCRWEWNAWLDREISLHILGEGAAPIYFIEVPGMYAPPILSEREVANEIAKLCQRNPDARYVGDVSAAVKEARRRQLTSPYLESENLVLPFFHRGVTELHLRDVGDVLSKLARHFEKRTQEVIAAANSDNEVPAYNKNFTGRRTELLQVRDFLKADQTGVVAGIQGLGGIGKTELAYTYAHAFAGVYPGGRYHIPCEFKNSLPESIFQLSDYAAFRPHISDEERKIPEQHYMAILRVLKQRSDELGPILLVLDNVTNLDLLSPTSLEPLNKLKEKLHLLATTREVPRANKNWITLGELKREEALAMLARFRRFDEDRTERAAAEAIVTKLGGFALALELLGGFLEVNPTSSYAAWADTIGLDDLDLLAEETNFELRRHQHERRLAEILGPTLNELSPEQQRLMQFAAYLPADLVPLPWLKVLLIEEFPHIETLDRLKRDPWEVLVDHLVRLGLLTRVNETETNRQLVRVHRLVQELVRRDLDGQAREQIQQSLKDHVRTRNQELHKTAFWEVARWEVEPLDAMAWLWDERNDPDTAWLMNQVGQHWYILAEWLKAERLYCRSLAIADPCYEAKHSDVANRLNNLAQLLKSTNRLAEAEVMMRRALAIDEQSYGAEHPDVARDLSNLAAFLNETNRFEEAELMACRALAINESSYGPEHANVAINLNILALILKNTHRLVESELMMRRALAIHEQCYKDEHPDVAIAKAVAFIFCPAELKTRIATVSNNLATLLSTTNRLAEAESLYRRALGLVELSYGSEHPSFATDLSNLAQLLKASNRLFEAELMMRRALAIIEQSCGPEHPSVAGHLCNVAALLDTTNRLAEAELLMRRALSIDEQSYGSEHPQVADDLKGLAQLLQDMNRLAEAEQLLRHALPITEQSYGVEHPKVAFCLNNLAVLLKITNRLLEAEPLCRRAVEIYASSLTNEDPNTITLCENYRQLLIELELQNEEIEKRLETAIAARGPFCPIEPEIERLLGTAKPVHEVLAGLDEQYRNEGRSEIHFLKPTQLISPFLEALLLLTPVRLNALGLSALHDGLHAEAAAYFETAYAWNEEKAYAPESKLVIRMNLGVALRELGGLELATEELSAVIAEFKREENQRHWLLGRCLFHFAKCQYLLGEPSEATDAIGWSLEAYAKATEDQPVPSDFLDQSQELLQILQDDTPPPPRLEVDIEAELFAARNKLDAILKFHTHPLDQAVWPLLEQMLGPAASTAEVLAALDDQYRRDGKPPVYFLPLDQPITPHLDELFGTTVAPEGGTSDS